MEDKRKLCGPTEITNNQFSFVQIVYYSTVFKVFRTHKIQNGIYTLYYKLYLWINPEKCKGLY